MNKPSVSVQIYTFYHTFGQKEPRFRPNLYLLPHIWTIGKIISLDFYSLIRNFGFAELTSHSEMKRKVSFLFAFHSLIRNFAGINTI